MLETIPGCDPHAPAAKYGSPRRDRLVLMNALRRKLLAAAVSGIAALALAIPAYLAYEASRPRQVIELRFAEPDGEPEGEGEYELVAGPDTGPPPAPDDSDAPSALELLDLEPVSVAFPPSAFVRWPWRDDAAVRQAAAVFDPFVGFRHASFQNAERPWREYPDGAWYLVTNSLGLREDREVSAARPDLRILIAGDSHTDGVCMNSEAFGNLLEARLRAERPDAAVESLNAGKGGYDLYHYLGTLERFLYLEPDVFVVALYGGNDFDASLAHFHRANGTRRLPGKALFGEQLERAMARDEFRPALAQSFYSFKNFDARPDQLEVAAQVARDVTTEILVTCLRHSIHPIIVYIPPLPDVEWATHGPLLNELSSVLEVSALGLTSSQHLADSYLDFLRARRVDVVDLREVFARAGPGNYWAADHHVNLRAQRLIAEALLPLVRAAHPPGTRPARRAPASRGPARPGDLLSPGSPPEPGLRTAVLDAPLGSLDDTEAEELWGRAPETVRDPLSGCRNASGLRIPSSELGYATPFEFVTDARGFRRDGEPPAHPIDLRVLVLGDEQTSGACENAASFAGRLESALASRRPDETVEVLNAAVRGHTFQNYLGVLHGALELEPDVVVLASSRGNDYLEALRLDRHLAEGGSLPVKRPRKVEQVLETAPGATRTSLESVAYFARGSRRAIAAKELAAELTMQVKRSCDAVGAALVVVDLPDAASAAREPRAAELEPIRELLELDPGDLEANGQLSDRFLRAIRSRGVWTLGVDLSALAPEAPAFLPDDYLISTAVHAELARALVEHLEERGLLP